MTRRAGNGNGKCSNFCSNLFQLVPTLERFSARYRPHSGGDAASGGPNTRVEGQTPAWRAKNRPGSGLLTTNVPTIVPTVPTMSLGVSTVLSDMKISLKATNEWEKHMQGRKTCKNLLVPTVPRFPSRESIRSFLFLFSLLAGYSRWNLEHSWNIRLPPPLPGQFSRHNA